jgi:hypothetical protein
MPKVDDKEYPYTEEGMGEAKAEAKKSGKKVKYHNPGPEKDDVRRAAESVGKEKIAGISVSLMFEPKHKQKKERKDERKKK